MMNDKIRFFEELAINAHASLKVQMYDGWLIRYANGHTKRANSVSVLYPSSLKLSDKIAYCEKQYAKAGLPCIFKLTDDDMQLNCVLEQRGYKAVDSTDVMIRELDVFSADTDNCVFTNSPTEEWLGAYFEFEGLTDKAKQDTFRHMLSNVTADTIYGAVLNNGRIVSCASAAIEHGYMLLQNVVTDPDMRGCGFGKKVCGALINEAKKSGADRSYLQVVVSNTVAVNLYKKLGFHKVYSYWYMVN